MKWALLVASFNFVVFYSVWVLKTRNNYLTILFLLACMWPLGKILQYWHFGPYVARWYVADIGFVPAFALFTFLLTMKINKKSLFWSYYWAAWGCIIAVAWEIICIVKVNPQVEPGTFGARGDWIDLILFVSTYCLVRIFLLPGLRLSMKQG